MSSYKLGKTNTILQIQQNGQKKKYVKGNMIGRGHTKQDRFISS